MDAAELSHIIEAEIGGNLELSNAHGVELSKCLVVPPSKMSFVSSFNKESELGLWLVLEEIPEDRSGYKIVYDEESQMFGLAMAGVDNNDHFIGLYGSFLETLEGM